MTGTTDRLACVTLLILGAAGVAIAGSIDGIIVGRDLRPGIESGTGSIEAIVETFVIERTVIANGAGGGRISGSV